MTLDLNDPRLAQAIVAAVDRRVEQRLAQLPQTRYGIVASVNTTNRTVGVQLGADAAPSGPIVYGSRTPLVGDLVRVILSPSGDRYVDDVLGSDELTLARLRLTAFDDVTLGSTLHALQIGLSSGGNLALDNNEVQARNNGAGSQLNLNFDGGLVKIGPGGADIGAGGLVLNGPLTGHVPFETAFSYLENISATSTDVARAPVPALRGMSDAFVEHINILGFNISGGSALSASHKWTLTFKKLAITTGILTTIATIQLDSGASTTWRALAPHSVGFPLNAGTIHALFTLTATKTGTPGNLYIYPTISGYLIP